MVTADGGFPYQDENNQEMEILNLCLGEIICALMILANNGSFILKIYESYTLITIKFILFQVI